MTPSNETRVAKNNGSEMAPQQLQPADFERAMSATGVGWFNVYLIVVAVPSMFASIFEGATVSYILPVAECDLKLTFVMKGWLNAASYAGMIMSAIVWGYLSDTLGRKKILVYGFLMHAICVFGSSLSQNSEMLILFKFMGGLIVNGPCAVTLTYLSELHGSRHRPLVMLVIGMVGCIARIALPMLAWAIFPRNWNFVLFATLNIYTWQIFLFVSGLTSLISSIMFNVMPESPKFLMSQGKNAEALGAFQYIYAFNSRKPKDTYPVKVLIEEVPNTRRENGSADAKHYIGLRRNLYDGMQQTKPMLRKPLLGRSLHVYALQFCVMLGMNTIRLWLPQLFASIGEYEQQNANVGDTSNLCTILEYSLNKTTTTVTNTNLTDCAASRNVSVSMYTNNIIVASSGLVAYFIAAGIVRLIGQKRLLSCGLFISAALAISLYWSTSGLTTLILSSAYLSVIGVSTSSLLSLALAFFPTTLRTLVVATSLMFGFLGVLSGNVLFPILVEIGCIPPFAMVSSVLAFGAVLSLLLPDSKKTTFT